MTVCLDDGEPALPALIGPARRSRLRGWDLVAVAVESASRRGLRTVLSSVGIGLGAAAVVAVLGLARSSEAVVLDKISHLSTLLYVRLTPGVGAPQSGLPPQAPIMANRIGPVVSAAGVVDLNIQAYRSDLVPLEESNGLIVTAVDPGLLDPLEGTIAQGNFLTAASSRLPDAVLGAVAARRLGIDRLGVRVRVGNYWFHVIGILNPIEGVPEMDNSVLVGVPAAQMYLDYHQRGYTAIYVRSLPDEVDAVASVLPATVDPGAPGNVAVVEAANLLAVRAVTKNALNSLVLALGAVGFIVGGLGVANTMLVSVIERRLEIGVRRALGARRQHIGLQFLVESMLLAVAGGVTGTAFGTLVVVGVSAIKGWPVRFPWYGLVGPIVGAVAIGMASGLIPALRAARVSPSAVLRSA